MPHCQSRTLNQGTLPVPIQFLGPAPKGMYAPFGPIPDKMVAPPGRMLCFGMLPGVLASMSLTGESVLPCVTYTLLPGGADVDTAAEEPLLLTPALSAWLDLLPLVLLLLVLPLWPLFAVLLGGLLPLCC